MSKIRSQVLTVVAVVAAAAALASPRGTAVAEEDDGKWAMDLRAKYPPLDLEDARNRAKDLAGKSTVALQDEIAWADRTMKTLKRRWTKLQGTERAVDTVSKDVLLRGSHYTLTLLSLEMEKNERMARANAREEAARRKRFPDGTPVDWDAWRKTPERQKAVEERVATLDWYRWALKEETERARRGESEAGKAIADVRARLLTEMETVAGTRRAVEKVLGQRAGTVPPDVEHAEPEELARAALRVAPLRTEYSAAAQEVVSAAFQIWKGRPPYVVTLEAPGSTQGPVLQTEESGGEKSVSISYGKPGAYQPKILVFDQDGEHKEIVLSFAVTAASKPEPDDEKADGGKPGGGASTGGGAPGSQSTSPAVAIAPFSGTYKAVLWLSAVGLPRPDKPPATGELAHVPPVPLTVTIDGAGGLKGRADYSVPDGDWRAPERDGAHHLVWKRKFDLEGKVDWTTGRVDIEIRGAQDENGWQVDSPGYGRWRVHNVSEYDATLSGWTIPGPTAATWLGMLQRWPKAAETLRRVDLEVAGFPAIAVAGDGTLSYASRGFANTPLPTGLKVPGAPKAIDLRTRKWVHTEGYDGKKPDVEDQTEEAKLAWRLGGALGVIGWQLKIVGLGTVEGMPPPPADPAETKPGDLYAFGVWPTRPISVPVGSYQRARAMGVFSDDVHDAVDLTKRSNWTWSGGIEWIGDGSFKATTPGTWTLTATFKGPDGPMSSTIRIVVPPE